MSNNYAHFLEAEGLPAELIDLVAGKIKLPDLCPHSSIRGFGFPPAYVPIVSIGSGSCSYGYWRHWFVSRQPTFVELFLEPTPTASEYARTTGQFTARMVLQLLEVAGGGSEVIRLFAEQVGVASYDILLQHWEQHGESESRLQLLPMFAGRMPLGRTLLRSGYDGSFPSSDFKARQKWWLSASSVEIDEQILADWPSEIPIPAYLTEQNGLALFERYLHSHDLRSAWLSLNSAGWEVEEAQQALAQLQPAAPSSSFIALVDAWQTASDGFQAMY